VNDWHKAFFIGSLPLLLSITCLLFLKESDDWRQSQTGTTTRKDHYTAADRANLLKGAIIFGSMLIGLWGMFSWIPTWVQSLLASSSGQTERGIAMMLLGAGGLTG